MDWWSPMTHPLAKQGHYRIYLRGRLSFGAVYVKVKNHFLKSTVNMMDPLAERSKAISRDVCSMELKLTVSGGSILAIWNAHCCSVIANHHSHNSHGVGCFSIPPLVKSFSPSKVGGCNGSHPRRILGLSDGQGKAQCSGSTSLAKHGDLMDIIIKHPETMGHFNLIFWYMRQKDDYSTGPIHPIATSPSSRLTCCCWYIVENENGQWFCRRTKIGQVAMRAAFGDARWPQWNLTENQ